MKKVYLGDGVYAQMDDWGHLRLTAEDGIQATDTIVLEADTWLMLKAYIESIE